MNLVIQYYEDNVTELLMPAAINLHKLLNEPVGHNFPELRAFSADIPGLLSDALN